MKDRYGPRAELRPIGGEGRRYAIVLAGGDGTRLHGVSERLYGYRRPKQFCTFGADQTLLEETLRRAARFTGSATRIVASVSRAHRAEVGECLFGWPEVARVEQPRNLDTAPGILLPLMRILAHDPWATVLVLPSDHHVSDDEAFVGALAEALPGLQAEPDVVLLAGARLRAPEQDLGWIVPGPCAGPWRQITRFVEKPPAAEVEALHGAGALANTFAMVARGAALARMGRRYVPHCWDALAAAAREPASLEALYDRLPACSFSREVLAKATGHLGVVPIEGVEWSDIGTPERLAAVRGVGLVAA